MVLVDMQTYELCCYTYVVITFHYQLHLHLSLWLIILAFPHTDTGAAATVLHYFAKLLIMLLCRFKSFKELISFRVKLKIMCDSAHTKIRTLLHLFISVKLHIFEDNRTE